MDPKRQQGDKSLRQVVWNPPLPSTGYVRQQYKLERQHITNRAGVRTLAPDSISVPICGNAEEKSISRILYTRLLWRSQVLKCCGSSARMGNVRQMDNLWMNKWLQCIPSSASPFLATRR